MRLGQRIKNTFKFTHFKHAGPFTASTLERETNKTRTSNFETVGAIHRFDVASGGFFKCRTMFKDKLFRCAITRYFILQCGAFCFSLGQFFLSRFVGISEYFNLILEESNTLSQDAVSFHSREDIKSSFSGGENGRNIHKKPHQ